MACITTDSAMTFTGSPRGDTAYILANTCSGNLAHWSAILNQNSTLQISPTRGNSASHQPRQCMQALKDTATVVALVALLATVLFALNTALTEGSKQLYSLRDPEHPLFSRKN